MIFVVFPRYRRMRKLLREAYTLLAIAEAGASKYRSMDAVMRRAECEKLDSALPEISQLRLLIAKEI